MSPHSVKRHKALLKRKSAPKAEQQRPRSASPHAKRKRDTPQQLQETEPSTTDLRAHEDPERTRRVWEEVLHLNNCVPRIMPSLKRSREFKSCGA